jgi:hypothetical protein
LRHVNQRLMKYHIASIEFGVVGGFLGSRYAL